MMETTGYSGRWCTNGEMARIVETNPDRFMYQPNISPIKHKCVKNTIWEQEYWVKEKGSKIFKFYPPKDTYINDPDLQPFYQKTEELGIVLDIHTGFSWVLRGKSKYALPIYIDDVARDFPELKINAVQIGYPNCADLNMIAMQHANVYVCLSLLIPWAKGLFLSSHHERRPEESIRRKSCRAAGRGHNQTADKNAASKRIHSGFLDS
jgi:hypothetical protein